MTLRELLAAQGIQEDVIAKIEAAMKEAKIFTAGEENLDIRYSKLKGQHDELVPKFDEATKLIEQLKKGGDKADLEKKVADYETQLAQMKADGEKAQLDSALKFALLAGRAKPDDVDYLIFKLRGSDEEIKLNKDGTVKGFDTMLTQLKAAHPANFEGAPDGKPPKPLPNPLPKDDKPPAGNEPKTLAEALQQRYEPQKE